MLKDAQRYVTLFDPVRLKVAREARGLSQTDLARAVGSITAPAISQFEGRSSKPSAKTLAEIAAALRFPVAFFTQHISPRENDERLAFFRSLRAARTRHKTEARALALIGSLLVAELEKHVELPKLDLIEHRVLPSDERRTVERAAEKLRARWGVAKGPIPNVLVELERRGIIVVRLPLEVEEIDAFSVAFSPRPIVMLSSNKAAADRSRFDAAHELGHLVMHHTPDDEEHVRIEKQAHWFAAAFLAPSEDLVHELPREIDWNQFAILKRRWGVSMAALVMRARDLGRISEGDYVRAMKYMSMKGWRKAEPVQLGAPERPQLLSKALNMLPEALTLRELADHAGLPHELVERLVGASADHRPRVEI